MNRNDLRRVDLNLLIVFETLMHERSVTRAAEKLFLGQPAISAALSRLRTLFDDPLFVRTGRSMEPTARAQEIFAHLSPALDSISTAMSRASEFDPATSTAVFRIGLSDDVEFGLLPPLLRRLRAEAPGIVLVVRRANYLLMPNLLASGEISVGVSYTDELPANAKRKTVRRSKPKILRADSAPGQLTLDDYCARPHALVSFAGDLSGFVDEELEKFGRKRKVVLAVPQFNGLGTLLAGTDIIATVPDYAAQEAKAAVAATQAQLDAARLNLSFTRITAPIDGRVSRAEVTAGNLVNSGETLLTTLVSTDKVYAYFDADERVFLKYVELARQAGRDTRSESPVYLGLSSEDGNPHLGRLDFLDNQVNPRTGTIRGRAVFDNAKGEFTPGLYVRLKLVGSKTYAATLIKDEAVGTDLGKKFVLVLDGDNKTVYRTVEMGPKLEGLRIVRSGLSKGDRIVVNGLQRVRPGMQVDPQKVEMASADTLATLARLRQSVGDSEPPKVAASKDNATRNEPRG